MPITNFLKKYKKLSYFHESIFKNGVRRTPCNQSTDLKFVIHVQNEFLGKVKKFQRSTLSG